MLVWSARAGDQYPSPADGKTIQIWLLSYEEDVPDIPDGC